MFSGQPNRARSMADGSGWRRILRPGSNRCSRKPKGTITLITAAGTAANSSWLARKPSLWAAAAHGHGDRSRLEPSTTTAATNIVTAVNADLAGHGDIGAVGVNVVVTATRQAPAAMLFRSPTSTAQIFP